MSSGQKQLVLNTRERALSTDINRLEAFIARDRSQLARFQFNDARLNYLLNPGVSKPNVGGEAPLVADCFGGLMVDPQTTSLLVTPGEIGCLFPDPSISADDSPYMLIDDPGITTAGILVFTANGGGGARVDLVECQPVSTVIESDSRDIFNPATGLFTPTSVTKVQAFRLQYRIRLGTAGAGVPALVAGWVPLAAIVTGTAATDFNGCDFFDVRPLVEDRVRPQSNLSSGSSNMPLLGAEYRTVVDTGNYLIGGFSLSQFGGYLAGGVLRRSTPSFSGTRGGTGDADGDPAFFNASLAENQDTGFSHTSHAYNSLCAFFPGGLPRWVRYSQTAVGGGFGRIPRGPRGVLVVISGDAGAPTGLAVRAIPTFGSCTGVQLGTVKSNLAGNNFVAMNAQATWVYTDKPKHIDVASTATPAQSTLLNGASDFPSAAKDLLLEIHLTYTDVATEPGNVSVVILDQLGVEIMNLGSFAVFLSSSGGGVNAVYRVAVPGRSLVFDGTLPSFTVKATLNSGSGVVVASAGITGVNVLGWSFGA